MYQYPDQVLLFVVLFLLAVGIVMVYSSSSVLSLQEYHHSLFYAKRQFFRVLVGLFFMVVLMFGDYRRLASLATPLCGLFFVLLLLVYIPGVGHGAGGSSRWINLYFTRLQPSEFFKIFYILYLAHYFAKHDGVKGKLKKVILPQLGFLLVVFLLIQNQPDLSTSLLVVAVSLLMSFLVYWEPKFWLTGFGLALVGLVLLIFQTPYRVKRVVAFLHPWENRLAEGYQVIQSLLSLGSGGAVGLGLGQSRQKFLYLPEEHTDFIFAVIGEEFGFVGGFLVILLFWLLLWRGIRVALNARDLFGKYLAFGITVAIGVQAALNLLVVVGLAPPTGVTLPFVSYGGSSLLTNLIAVGILLNVSRFSYVKRIDH